MKFTIYTVQNGRFLLNVTYSREKIESHVFTAEERMKMLALIDKLMGPEPGAEDETEEPPPPTDQGPN